MHTIALLFHTIDVVIKKKTFYVFCMLSALYAIARPSVKQESPAGADKHARRESMPKLLQFDVLTTLSLTILVYLHSFSWNLRNPEKFSENSNL